ncbi:Mss4-like protein [Mycena sp. CBHHK59/15]|nr:Mss4-like protein [Mycena sp. CBHHK59/15]
MPHTGSCLCGQTTISLNSTHTDQVCFYPANLTITSGQLSSQIICHCTDCRQTSGSAFSTNVLAPKKDVTITGPVKEYSIKAASGNTVTRVFCSNCGSAVSHLTAAFGTRRPSRRETLLTLQQSPSALNVRIAVLHFLLGRLTGESKSSLNRVGPVSLLSRVPLKSRPCRKNLKMIVNIRISRNVGGRDLSYSRGVCTIIWNRKFSCMQRYQMWHWFYGCRSKTVSSYTYSSGLGHQKIL